MEGGRGWREGEDGGRERIEGEDGGWERMEGGRGWRVGEDGGRERTEGGRGWREGERWEKGAEGEEKGEGKYLPKDTMCNIVPSRAHRAAEGGERACNFP